MRFIDYDKSDLRLEIFKQIFFIEAAVKSNRNFGFVSQGARPSRYCSVWTRIGKNSQPVSTELIVPLIT